MPADRKAAAGRTPVRLPRLKVASRARDGAASLQTAAVATLREAIVSGELPLGSRLSEPQLARQLKTSRTPIREALSQLEHEQLVAIVPHVGSFVRSMTPEDVEEIYQVRLALETLAVSLIVKRLTPISRGEITHAVSEMEAAAASGDAAAYANARDTFHFLIVRLSGNRRLIELYKGLNGPIRLLRRIDFTTRERIAASLEANVRVAKAILAQDPAVVRYITEHLENACQAVAKSIAKRGTAHG